MPSLIDSPDNGATEVPGTSADALFVFLAGPIRHWWAEGQWGSTRHGIYVAFRDMVHGDLSEEFLVYAPHRAWRGPWNEVAQRVNDSAVQSCHALVDNDADPLVRIGEFLDGFESDLPAMTRLPTTDHRMGWIANYHEDVGDAGEEWIAELSELLPIWPTLLYDLGVEIYRSSGNYTNRTDVFR